MFDLVETKQLGMVKEKVVLTGFGIDSALQMRPGKELRLVVRMVSHCLLA